MNQALKENVVSQIISGQQIIDLKHTTLVVKNPNSALKCKANAIYHKCLEDEFYEEWLSDEQVVNILIRLNLWSHDSDKNLKIIEKTIEDLKIELYKTYLTHPDISKLRTNLTKVKQKQNSMLNTRHSLDYATREGYAEMVKTQFLMYSTIYTEDNVLLWPNVNDVDFYVLEQVVNIINSRRLSITNFRQLAREEPWHSIWSVAKEQPFEKCPIEWSEEQKTLVLFSKMYDNIYSHPEAPNETIVNDDDLIDGWMALNRRNREKQKIESQIEASLPNHYKNASEIFYPARDVEHAKKINTLNDAEGRMIKRQREAVIKANGEVSDANLPDVRQDLMIQATNQSRRSN